MRHVHVISSVSLLAAVVLCGCRSQDPSGNLTLPSGTTLDVTLGTTLSSESAKVGDAWSGSIRNASVVNGQNVIPVGTTAAGRVSGVTTARKGDRAMLDLELTSITVGNRNYRVHGSTDSVIAGSPRARNLGAIAGSAVAGALLGRAVGGNGKDAVIGGIIGAGVATEIVAESKGWQVVLKQGIPLTFTTSEAVAVRL